MSPNLDRWMCYCQDLESDSLFIEWTFYATISAALQRRVCLDQIPHVATPQSRPLFPNLYIIFIGPPGCGKSSAAGVAKGLFQSFGGFESLDAQQKRIIKVAPSSMTIEQLTRYLNNNYTLHKLPDQYATLAKDSTGKHIGTYISTPIAFLATEELGSLFREHTSDLVNLVTEGYDCGDYHRETKTQGVDFIKHMCVMLFGAATPTWVKEVSKNGLLKQGFSARTIFVYAEKKRHLRARWRFDRPEQLAAWEDLRTHVRNITKLYGPVRFSPEAERWIDEWYENGGELPRNKDKRLEDYYGRKKVHLIKTAMVMHYADNLGSEISLACVKRALALLERTELTMHKALLGATGDNPAEVVAQKIEDMLVNGARTLDGVTAETHFVKESAILLNVWGDCLNGRATFDEAIGYLVGTGRAVAGQINGKVAYRATRKPEQDNQP